MTDFRMPSLGADMEFGTVVDWRVKPGDRIARGDIVVEVETEKGVFEVESPADGVVDALLVATGTKVPVGTPLATVRGNGATPPAAAPVGAPAAVPSAAAVPPRAVAPRVPPPPPDHARPRASPLARRMAQALGVDLRRLTGTGAEGAIVKADVERAAAAAAVPSVQAPPSPAPAPAAGPPPPIAPSAPDDAHAAMRRAVAAAVSRSKREIPHYYLASDIDLGRALTWLRDENARRSIAERLLPAALLFKATASALRAYPELNGFWKDGRFQPGEGIHIGMAISLRGGGLIAPAIHHVDRLSMPEVMAALSDLARRARTGGLRGSEMTDATVTVSNLGDEGAATVFGVIYPPQVALIGFGRIIERPWAERGLLGVRPIVTATLAADHRATDGHYGALFLGEMTRLLQTPEAL